MNEQKKFGAYLCFWIGLSLCAMSFEDHPASLTKSRVEDTRQPVAGEFNPKIYRDRTAYEKDREFFIKTICEKHFDSGALEFREYECL